MRTSPLATVLVALAATHTCVCEHNRITVAVYNYAAVPDGVLRSAVNTARRAFGPSHVETQWVICDPDACREPLAPGSFLELILLPRVEERLRNGRVVYPAGYALHGHDDRQRAYASYRAAQQAAAWTIRPVELALACILIHEAGHLLGLGHQAHGAMRANLDARDMDDAIRGKAFSAAEGEILRAAVKR